MTKSGNAHMSEIQNLTNKLSPLQSQLNHGFQSVETLRKKAKAEKIGAKHPTANTSHTQENPDFGTRRPKDLTNNDANTMFDLSARHSAENLNSKNQKAIFANGDFADSEDSLHDAPQTKEKGKSAAPPFHLSENTQDDQARQDLTYLSFLDVRRPFEYILDANANPLVTEPRDSSTPENPRAGAN